MSDTSKTAKIIKRLIALINE